MASLLTTGVKQLLIYKNKQTDKQPETLKGIVITPGQ